VRQAPLEPWGAMAAAVSRERAGYEGMGAFHAEQRLTNLEAFQASTWNNKVSLEVSPRRECMSRTIGLRRLSCQGRRCRGHLHCRGGPAGRFGQGVARDESSRYIARRTFYTSRRHLSLGVRVFEADITQLLPSLQCHLARVELILHEIMIRRNGHIRAVHGPFMAATRKHPPFTLAPHILPWRPRHCFFSAILAKLASTAWLPLLLVQTLRQLFVRVVELQRESILTSSR
jgi:hypothetical protein